MKTSGRYRRTSIGLLAAEYKESAVLYIYMSAVVFAYIYEFAGEILLRICKMTVSYSFTSCREKLKIL